MLPKRLIVFLCYSSRDKDIVRELYERLLKENWIEPWLDEKKLLPGQDWDLAIEKAVENSHAVIVCTSNHSVTKEGYVQKELRFILDIALTKPEEEIFVIPLRLDNCQPPRRLRTFHYVDYFPETQQNTAYKMVLESLKLRAETIGVEVVDRDNTKNLIPKTPLDEVRTADTLKAGKETNLIEEQLKSSSDLVLSPNTDRWGDKAGITSKITSEEIRSSRALRLNNKANSVSKQLRSLSDLRPSPIAGTWYEGNPNKLAKYIDETLDKVPQKIARDKVVGLMMPNAGYAYDMFIAAESMAQIQGREFDTVAIISQYSNFHNSTLLVSSHEAYVTPLGAVPIDHDMLSRVDTILKKKIGTGLTPIANDREHSIEVVLPILQRAILSDFSILPIMMRPVSYGIVESVGYALGDVLQHKNALLVASSGLSLFNSAEVAAKFDRTMLDAILTLSPKKVFQTEEEGKGFANGHNAVATVMLAAKLLGATKAVEIAYGHSGMVTGDNSSVSGYGAVVFIK